jgi:hypothetical protein
MPFPIVLNVKIPGAFREAPQTVTIRAGLTTFVGPNGSGKTQALHAMRAALSSHVPGKHVRYISPGRLALLEYSRSDLQGQSAGIPNFENDVHIAQEHMQLTRHNSSGLTGDLFALQQRADLRIKVEARLSALFGRRFRLTWTSTGLHIRFTRTDRPGGEYKAGREASGLVHLVALLTAAYDDSVGALLVDEPEVSLHPQLQAYLLGVLRDVAGDPAAAKKIVVIATHSPTMLYARRPADLTNIVFFSDIDSAPTSLAPEAGELQAQALRGLLARMGDSHRSAFVAPRVLLVEGVSDEIVVHALAARLELGLDAAGTQVLPVIGKGQMAVVRKLFALLGKGTSLLTDLDGLLDDNAIVSGLTTDSTLQHHVRRLGHASLQEWVRAVKGELMRAVEAHYRDLATSAEEHPYWTKRDRTKDESIARHRAATAVLLQATDVAVQELTNGATIWAPLRTRLVALLDTLEIGGCFVLRRGDLESYTLDPARVEGLKPEGAVVEAALIAERPLDEVRGVFADVVRAIEFAAARPKVSEADELRVLLLAALAPCLARCQANTSGAEPPCVRRVVGSADLVERPAGAIAQGARETTTT